MRIYLLLLVPLLIWGCEQTYDEIIDSGTDNYQVSSIAGIKDTIDLRIEPGDSLLNLRLIFTPPSQVYKAYFDIYASDKSKLNSTPVEMYKIIDDLYENQFILRRENPNGNYAVRFYAEGFEKGIKQVALGKFYFRNGQDNVAPVISNLVIPDSIAKGVFFNFSVLATDPNGLNDIRREDGVFFNLYRPDSTIVQASPFYMHDDGDPGFGDDVAGDGIFSFRNSFLQDTTTQVGNWRFVFQARDRSGLVSNIIEHFMFVHE